MDGLNISSTITNAESHDPFGIAAPPPTPSPQRRRFKVVRPKCVDGHWSPRLEVGDAVGIWNPKNDVVKIQNPDGVGSKNLRRLATGKVVGLDYETPVEDPNTKEMRKPDSSDPPSTISRVLVQLGNRSPKSVDRELVYKIKA
jgi:hypothetical protein